ncbi:MAG: DUF4154 domain-containing protein [Ignavibacteriales bacterium]|nr:DUF4154 domain-containing protein [Ignavibacteriales bacterium]
MRPSKTLIFIGLFAAISMQAAAQTVPAPLQAALFKKILSFDKTLAGKSDIEVVVIGGAADIISALNGVGIKAKAGSAAEGDVVYVAAGATPPKAATAKAGILSVSGSSAFAENGQVSVAIGIEDGKPKIFINMNQLKAERHEFSADLLKLAKVIK